MRQKYYLIIILAIIGVTLISIWLKQNPQEKCEPNYVIDNEHELIPDRQTNPQDLEIIQKFNREGRCLNGSDVQKKWVQEPEPMTTDSPYEKVMYCEDENKFLVVKSLGLLGAKFYLYDGKPCK